MSIKNWNAGIIRPVAVAPTGPFQSGAAPGVWTLDQAAYWTKQGLWPTAGLSPNYIEDMFSTYLYTGNGATQTIVNEIDLAGKGGLVWFKPRNTANNHNLIDSARGLNKFLITNNSAANGTTGAGYGVSSFNSDGFSLAPPWTSSTNTTDTTQASWTFRKQPKFFDVQTFTSNGSGGATVSHSLGSTPGFVIVKNTGASGGWAVWHRSMLSTSYYTELQTTNAQSNLGATWLTPSSTNIIFDAGALLSANANYVMYVFAHDAGGFGLSGNENVVSCGTCVSNSSGFIQPVTLGYEPQWIMIKRINSTGNWFMLDTLRGMYNDTSAASPVLFANLADAEVGTGTQVNPTATGFQDTIWGGWGASNTYIYVAIRRGPMAVPTLGTTVYNAIARTGTGAAVTVTGAGFTPDWLFTKMRSNVGSSLVVDRLRGTPYLQTNNTNAEAANGAIIDTTTFSTTMDGFRIPGGSSLNNFVPYTYINYLFKRAPSFFDEVCYTGTGGVATYAHNLGVVPELMIFKIRSGARRWPVYTQPTGNTQALVLNVPDAVNSTGNNYFNSTSPTSTVFTVNGSFGDIGDIGNTFVAYLFATCAGVSKVGSYTGTGTTLAINCGFTAGARFVLIKRTDDVGDWYYWDSARGIVAGDDPYLLMNSTALEVTNTDYIDTSAAGFEISSTAPAAINANGGTFIFLAIS